MKLRNIQFQSRKQLSPWQKISLGSWRTTGDSSLLFIEKISLKNIRLYIKEVNEKFNCNSNLNGFFCMVFGRLLREHPEFNVMIRNNQIYQRSTVDVFFHVLQNDDAKSLSGIILRSACHKNLAELDLEFKSQLPGIRSGETDHFQNVKGVFKFVPTFLSRPILNFVSFITCGLNISLKSLSIPDDPFGSLMISNLGQLGVRTGFTVIAPYTRVPMVVALCQPYKGVAVNEQEQPEVSEFLDVTLTIDHRVADGYHIGRLLTKLKSYSENPWLINKYEVSHDDN